MSVGNKEHVIILADVAPAATAGRIKLEPVNKAGAPAPPVAAVIPIAANVGKRDFKLKASGRPVSARKS